MPLKALCFLLRSFLWKSYKIFCCKKDYNCFISTWFHGLGSLGLIFVKYFKITIKTDVNFSTILSNYYTGISWWFCWLSCSQCAVKKPFELNRFKRIQGLMQIYIKIIFTAFSREKQLAREKFTFLFFLFCFFNHLTLRSSNCNKR